MIDKPIDLTSMDQASLPQLNEIIAKICGSAATIKYTDVIPTVETVAEGELVIYDNNAGTMGAYVITQKKHLFGINNGANFFNLGSIPAGAGVIPAANIGITITGLGTPSNKSLSTIYQASTDGFVVGTAYGEDSLNYILYSDSSASPSTIAGKIDWNSITTNCGISFCVPIKKNNYYQLVFGGSGDTGNSGVELYYFISHGT